MRVDDTLLWLCWKMPGMLEDFKVCRLSVVADILTGGLILPSTSDSFAMALGLKLPSVALPRCAWK
jgi:hypothetical protein